MSVLQEEQRHLSVVRAVAALSGAEAATRDRRGFERQQARRELESRVRQRAVFLVQKLRRQHWSHALAARRLGLERTTLAQWRERWRRQQLRSRPRGRPVQHLSTKTLCEIRAALEVHGPGTGLATLQQLFPEVPRRELNFQLKRFRKSWRQENRQTVQSLRWNQPGFIWAMDFTDPNQALEGPFRKILVVRDLGSGKNLLWLPLERATGHAVFDALRGLFAKHGQPLCIKIDNAKAFLVPELQGLIERLSILYLKSPPYAPWYNGSVESGIGTVKVYVHHQAARHDHPEYWTCDDLEAAKRRANYYHKPHGLDGPNANELWATRGTISAAKRQAFRQQVLERWASIVTAEQNEHGGELTKPDLARAVRSAIQWVLISEGILSVRRRRISPPIKRRKAS